MRQLQKTLSREEELALGAFDIDEDFVAVVR
jgi:hypothetical protein